MCLWRDWGLVLVALGLIKTNLRPTLLFLRYRVLKVRVRKNNHSTGIDVRFE